MRKAFHGYILIAPVMIGCLVFTLVPFGIVLRYSFTQGYGAAGMFVGMEHYTKMFQNDLFRLAFFNTMKFLTICFPWFSTKMLSYYWGHVEAICDFLNQKKKIVLLPTSSSYKIDSWNIKKV